MINEYDEIKKLLKKSRMLQEASGPINLDMDVETEIQMDTQPQEDKEKSYRISGGELTLHGKAQKDLQLSTDEKNAFQETMDEFVEEVSDLSDFGRLNMYPNNVEWSGKVIDFDIEFYYTIGEKNGVYINGNMIKLDQDLIELINKLTSYYEKFKSKWARILSQRKKTMGTGLTTFEE